MSFATCHRLRLILGDQLDIDHSWFEKTDPDTVYLLAEMMSEATYARHHVQKVAAFFAAMAGFAETLRASGHRVIFLTLDETAEFADFPALIGHILQQTGARQFGYQVPDEYRLVKQFQDFTADSRIDCVSCESEHFFLSRDVLPDYFPLEKQWRMENFYRRLRRETGYLMGPGEKSDQPVGGRWNFDAENRKSLPADCEIPLPLLFEYDATEIVQRLRRHKVSTIGHMADNVLTWPVTAAQSVELLNDFVQRLLPRFGDYQDAMTDRDWALFHSRLSFAMNAKLISPRAVVEAALLAWEKEPEHYPLSSVEGFIRQILGWREYMRGIYWMRMPDYANENHLNHQRSLPGFYWTGNTKMACLAQAIGQSLEHAYAHHIQRLMLTGNFALLAGVHPDAVDEWYLGIYIDAIEWVEMPNTRGMSQYADGGLVASKPYVSSGNYIKKMGDHCRGCEYDVKQRVGPDACPFNFLYWHFMDRHRNRLAGNPRIGMAYRNWDRMDVEKRDTILKQADAFLLELK